MGRGDGSGIATTRTSGPSIEPDQQGGGGGVGSAPGSNPLGAANPLDVHGVPLTILGKPSQGAPSTTAAGDRSLPLTNAGGGNINGLAGSGSVPSDVPINVHQDSNVVPLERKPMVREYFSDANN